MKVPMLDLNAQYEPIKEDVLQAMRDVFDSKKFINGPQIAELESKIAEYCRCKYAIGVSSGTDAILISLMAFDIGVGDEVITTPFTFFATAGCIYRVGAKPVFVDIDPQTYNINPDLIEEKITDKTKAIIPVHLFGQTAEMDKINEIAKKHDLYVIEDAAQAIGSEYKGKRAGSLGDVGCFSFFPSKNLGCCGDGGMVTTDNEELAEKIRVLRAHGSKPKYYHKIIGGNFRIDTIQAAVILVKFPLLEKWHKGRKDNAKYYDDKLEDVVGIPYVENYNKTIYNQYTIRTENRDKLQQYLNDSNIGNAIYYPVPLHLQECFVYLGYKEGDCPEAEKAANEVISIPIYPELTDEQKDYVIEKVINGINILSIKFV
ncbi:MAG: DegT/DnrJ/EryC1/StrS family aminotransferase [Candidatus Cloacimonetes bacterium]|nr:DegT/DnrJ/EryC1/StrS family aminotransferase [Candidatus Cloacimonadota bacterium]MBL7085867.1 DegT/DnrJ/EryC1/StrS family aminotransferase [Candidatus Cloacimonadota bacterium]